MSSPASIFLTNKGDEDSCWVFIPTFWFRLQVFNFKGKQIVSHCISVLSNGTL